jgi:hypothetical protein
MAATFTTTTGESEKIQLIQQLARRERDGTAFDSPDSRRL